MTWTQNIDRWRRLPAEIKLRHRWDSIPADVAQSMAFEGEPVAEEDIHAMLARITPPAGLLDRDGVKMPALPKQPMAKRRPTR